MACSGNEDMDGVGVANALTLYVVNIELEWYVAVDGSVCFEGFKAIEGDKEHGHDASCPYTAVWLGRRANHSVILHSAGTAVALDGEAKEWHGEVVFVSAIKESIVAYASEEFVLIPYHLGTGEAVGMADFGNRRCAPGCVDRVFMLPAGYFRCLVCLLPAVDKGSAGAHKDADKACGHVEVTIATVLFLD